MCFGGGGGTPAPVQLPPLPPTPRAPSPVDPSIARSKGKDRRQAALAQGRSSTVLTSGLGLTDPATSAKKPLLGV